MREILDKHYRRLAKDYDRFLYYSPDFVRALTEKMVEKLRLRPDDVLADIGCGTGMYSLDILKQVPLRSPVLGVDPYQEMLDQIPGDAAITPVNEDALAYSARPGDYNKILIKETVHHIDRREEFFRNLHRNLPSGGILLLVHVPPDVQYPLFAKALDRCLRWHANPHELKRQLESVGFDVDWDVLDYEHALPKEHYLQMVADCYMSVLTSFSDDELESGLAEMKEKYADADVLRFVDHFDYLIASKP